MIILLPMGNELVTLLKETSLVSVIGAGDLLTLAQRIGATNLTRMEMLMVSSIWYLVLTSLANIGQCAIERRFLRGPGYTQNDSFGWVVLKLLSLRRADSAIGGR